MNPSNFAGWLTSIFIAFALTAQLSCAQTPPEAKRPNRAPVIENINYTPDTMASSEVQIECLAKDADGDNLTYQWKPVAGKITGSGRTVWWTPPGKMGTYPITLAVTDGKGGVATENISIRVVTNADGTATALVELQLNMGDAGSPSVYKQRIRNWFEMDILCLVGDAGATSDLTYAWSATGGELKGKGLEDGKVNKIRWKAPGIKGDYTVNVTVKDAQGREAKGQVIITVFCCGDS